MQRRSQGIGGSAAPLPLRVGAGSPGFGCGRRARGAGAGCWSPIRLGYPHPRAQAARSAQTDPVGAEGAGC